MRIATLSLLLVLFAAHALAAPSITGIDPLQGFTFGPTHVTIAGSGFTDGAVEVFFGDVKATVLNVTPTAIRVLAFPSANGLPRQPGLVDVKVRVAGSGEAILTNVFEFHPLAQAGPEDYETVIIPLTSLAVPGAHGSVWSSELRIFNASDNIPLRMPGPEEVIQELPFDPAIVVEPHQTERVFVNRRDTSVDGAFLYVPKPLADAAKMSLRVRDTSKNAASLGTDIPVVRGSDAAGDLTLIDIPVEPQYRVTLRIYAFTAAPMEVRVTIYPEDGFSPIDHLNVELRGIVNTLFDPFPSHPAYLALDPLTAAVRAEGGRVRLELTNYNQILSPPPPPIWAFVSITNNETQQVTVVTPK
jgi:hypothetical protein